MILKEVADDVGISFSSCQALFTGVLGTMVPNDNASAHTSMLVREFLAKNKIVNMSQSLYSLDLVPAFLFS